LLKWLKLCNFKFKRKELTTKNGIKKSRRTNRKIYWISEKKWVKGINNSNNSVGLTFEALLNKNPDSMYFPDYYGIEIKCSQRFSRYPITLFSLSFDGPGLYEMNRLITTYGQIDIQYNEKYQFQGLICTNKYTQINNNYFKLKIDKKNNKIIIGIYDLNYKKNRRKNIYWF